MLFFIYRLLKPESVFIASSTKTYPLHTLLHECAKTNLKLLSPQHKTINSSMVYGWALYIHLAKKIFLKLNFVIVIAQKLIENQIKSTWKLYISNTTINYSVYMIVHVCVCRCLHIILFLYGTHVYTLKTNS